MDLKELPRRENKVRHMTFDTDYIETLGIDDVDIVDSESAIELPMVTPPPLKKGNPYL